MGLHSNIIPKETQIVFITIDQKCFDIVVYDDGSVLPNYLQFMYTQEKLDENPYQQPR